MLKTIPKMQVAVALPTTALPVVCWRAYNVVNEVIQSFSVKDEMLDAIVYRESRAPFEFDGLRVRLPKALNA